MKILTICYRCACKASVVDSSRVMGHFFILCLLQGRGVLSTALSKLPPKHNALYRRTMPLLLDTTWWIVQLIKTCYFFLPKNIWSVLPFVFFGAHDMGQSSLKLVCASNESHSCLLAMSSSIRELISHPTGLITSTIFDHWNRKKIACSHAADRSYQIMWCAVNLPLPDQEYPTGHFWNCVSFYCTWPDMNSKLL